MKKMLALVLIMTLLFSLAACSSGSGSKNSEQGSKETVVSEQSKEDDKTEAVDGATSEDSTTSPEEIAEFKDFIKDYVDLTHYDNVSSKVAISLKDEFKHDYELKDDVSLVNDIKVVYEDDIEIKKGTKYQEFLDKGWEPKGYLDYASLEKNYIYSGVNLYKNDKSISISLMTEKKEKTPIKDCVVASLTESSCELNINDHSFDFSKKDPTSPDYMINGKISKTSGLKDIISVFGEPSFVEKYTQKNGSESLLVRYFDTNNGELEFYVSPDGKVIGRFTINWYVQFKR